MGHIKRSQRGAGRRWRLVLGVMALLLATGVATSTVVASDLSPDGPSLAQGHAEVIAHGVALMPTVPVIWRAVSDPAKLPAAAPVGSRDLGFVVADRGAVLITSGGGDQTRLAPGEAGFVRNGEQQSRASLGTGSAQYDAIELVPATAKNAIGTGTFLGASDSFTAPSGHRDLTLVRDVLKPNETSTLPSTGAPTMVLVTSGTAQVQAGSTTNTQGAGGAFAYTGQVKVTATGTGGATFVAAMIGPAISSTTAPQDQAQATGAALPPATGVIRVTTHVCQPGMDLSNFDQSRCQVTQKGIDFSLTSSLLPRAYTLQDALDAGDGAFAWQQLPFGSYHIVQTQLPPGYNGYWIQTSAETGGGPGNGYDTAIAANSPARDLQVFDFSPGEQGGVAPGNSTAVPGEHNGVSGPQPTAAPPAPTQGPTPTNPPTTSGQVGDLLIQTQDESGNALAGACYELQGSGGTFDACDDGGNDALSGDSRILLTQLPAGDYTLTNTQVPTGYGIAANQSVTVIANGAFPNGEAIVTVTLPNGIG